MKKKKKNKHATQKIGAPPGELFYTGTAQGGQTRITLIQYNETELIEQSYSSIHECIQAFKPGLIQWINIEGIHQLDVVENLGKHFNIHALTMEDIVHVEQRPKFEDYDHYLLAIMKMIYFDNHVLSEQLSLLLFENTVLSFQEPHGGDAFDMIRNRIRSGKGRVRKMKADYLAYALIDAVVDCYFHVLEKVGEKIEQLDDEITNNNPRVATLKLHDLKREMIFLRKQVWPMREMINNMSRCDNELIGQNTDLFFRDLQDHITRIMDTIETYREMLNGIQEVYLSNNANKLNEVMKALTVISAIFIPVTFIAGVYGMNFKYMPEINSPYGYYIIWAVMISIMIGLGYYFKRKNWW